MFTKHHQKIVFSALFCLVILVTPEIAKAATVIPSPTPSLNPQVEGIRDEVKKAVQEKLAALGQGKEAGFFGKITEVKETSFILEIKDTTVEIAISEETQIFDSKKQEISLSQLKVGTTVIAMGFLNTENILEAKRIVETINTTTKKPAREVAFGYVDDISNDGEKILTVKNEKKRTDYTVEVVEATIISKKIDGKVEKAQFSDIEKGDLVVAIGTPSKTQLTLITAKIIHVIPSNRPTPSVSPKATPSVKITPTVKPKATPTLP